MRSIDQELGFRQIGAMLRSGLPLMASIESCAEQSTRSARHCWQQIGKAVAAGERLAEAIQKTGKFDAYVISLVRVGEETGELDHVLKSAADYLEQRRAHRAMVINALFYPVIVVLMTGAVIWFMLAKVIPALKQFLEANHAKLPEITQLLIDCSDAVCKYTPRALIIIGFAAVALWLSRRSPAVREFTDAALFKLPIVGGILRLSATAVFARALSLLLESGVTLLAALDSVATLFANARLVRRVNEARDAVIRGGNLAESLIASPEFRPMMGRMVSVGESTGTLGQTLAEVATFHETLLAAAIKRFGMIIEPLMVVIVGLIVGFVYIAFFLAIFSLSGAR